MQHSAVTECFVQSLQYAEGGAMMLEALPGEASASLSLVSANITRCAAYSESSAAGGFLALYDGATAQMREVVISECSVHAPEVFGGAVYTSWSSLTIDRSTVRACNAVASGVGNSGGGFMFNEGDSQIVISSTLIESCRATSVDGDATGGALMLLLQPTLRMSSTSIAQCQALAFGSGGGFGGGLFVISDGTVATLTASAINDCEASSSGGGLQVDSGAVLFGNASTVGRGRALIGRGLWPKGGTINYAFPLPPGTYLPNARCLVYREPCPAGVTGTRCRASFGACNTTADPDQDDRSSIAFVDASKCEPAADCAGGPGSLTHCPRGQCPCQPRTLIQPCDWANYPQLLGTLGYTLPSRLPVEDDFPFACAPGLLGSTDPASQISARCAGLCPAGHLCPNERTTMPAACPVGFYCPMGSVTPSVCPPGTFSNATNLTSAAECRACPPGHWCSGGEAVACIVGFYNPNAGASAQGTCIRCPPQSTTRSAASAHVSDCVCLPGYLDQVASRGSVHCVKCVVGTHCTELGTSLPTMPVRRGYFRLSANSSDVQRCPDASVNCSDAPSCDESTSACYGTARGSTTSLGLTDSAAGGRSGRRLDEIGTESSGCRANLTGVFCRRCARNEQGRRVYYSAAGADRPAECVYCREAVRDSFLVVCGVVIALGLAGIAALRCYRSLPLTRKEQLASAWRRFSPHVKLKIIVAFYLIATGNYQISRARTPPSQRCLEANQTPHPCTLDPT